MSIIFLDGRKVLNIIPKKGNLNIFYEDEDILVLDKPANLPVHPSKSRSTSIRPRGSRPDAGHRDRGAYR